jgi:SAM-dependent methyltransferase
MDLYSGGPPPWDIGRPQPAFLALVEAGTVRGRVLDAGCGTGEHVLLCAARGLDATGIDVSATALRGGTSARFLYRDARQIDGLEESFDTVLDCGLFHALHGDDRAAYVAGDHGWRVDGVEPATMAVATGPAGLRAWLVAVTRTGAAC